MNKFTNFIAANSVPSNNINETKKSSIFRIFSTNVNWHFYLYLSSRIVSTDICYHVSELISLSWYQSKNLITQFNYAIYLSIR